MNNYRLKAFFQILIIACVVLIVSFIMIPGVIDMALIVFALTFAFFFIFTLFCAFKEKKYEEENTESHINLKKINTICVVTACKNEGETIVNTVKHYLSLSEKIIFVLYDDGSDDGSYEKLLSMINGYNGRFELRKLNKRDIQIHPKAFALEDAFNSIECDYFLVIDSDSIFEKNDFQKSINALKNDDLDLLHITRKNDFNSCITSHMGNVEELMFSGLRLINFQTSVFGGSGFFVKSEMVRGFNYDACSQSEDTYLNNYLKKKKAKIKFFFSLYCHERAPETFKSFLKQRYNWINGCIRYFLLHEFSQLCIWNVIFSIVFVSLFNPFSIGLILVTFCSGSIIAIELSLALAITKENVFKEIIYSIVYLLTAGYIVIPIFIWIQIKIVFRKSFVKFEKNAIK